MVADPVVSSTLKKEATRATIEWASGRDSTYTSRQSIIPIADKAEPTTPATIVQSPADESTLDSVRHCSIRIVLRRNV